MRSVSFLALAGALSITAVAGCGGGDDKTDGGGSALSIDSSDSTCAVSKVDLPSGSNKFKITNSGSKVTEVYFYGPDGKIVSEKENIGPGTFYEITVTLGAGKQQIVCKPGMVGDGIK